MILILMLSPRARERAMRWETGREEKGEKGEVSRERHRGSRMYHVTS